MKKLIYLAVCMMAAAVARADSFGTFDIDFVSISGSTNPTSGYGIVNKDYRMGTYEITNAQFAKFASNSNVYWTGADVPSNRVSWFEAAQFVNYLNTSKGYQTAYKFTDSIFSVWAPGDAGYSASNPYRNSNAFYFLPTENEWVKAAYWNGTTLQTYATKAGETVTLGNGTSSTGWNYNGEIGQPWDVGSGSQELNNTYDMMGNVYEWMESPFYTGDCLSGSYRGLRGGSYTSGPDVTLASSYRFHEYPDYEYDSVGFRVASVPEPASLALLGLGGLALRYRKRSV